MPQAILGLHVHALRKEIAERSEMVKGHADQSSLRTARTLFKGLLDQIYNDLKLVDSDRKPQSVADNYELGSKARHLFKTIDKFIALSLPTREG